MGQTSKFILQIGASYPINQYSIMTFWELHLPCLLMKYTQDPNILFYFILLPYG
jgi:hypothetical protein